MKKCVALLMVLMIILTVFSGCAAGTADDVSGSKFEQVLLKKGSLIVKEFIDCGYFHKDRNFRQGASTMSGYTDTLAFEMASLLDINTGKKVYALRIRTGYWLSQYNYGESVGIMDADEIDGAIKTLQYIKKNISSLKDYSEIIYTASSGMQVGAYHSTTKNQLFVKVDSNATKFYDISEIDSLIESFQSVQAKLGK